MSFLNLSYNAYHSIPQNVFLKIATGYLLVISLVEQRRKYATSWLDEMKAILNYGTVRY